MEEITDLSVLLVEVLTILKSHEQSLRDLRADLAGLKASVVYDLLSAGRFETATKTQLLSSDDAFQRTKHSLDASIQRLQQSGTT